MVSIQKLLTEDQDTFGILLKKSFKLTSDVAELKNSMERNRQEVTNLKIEKLEKELTKITIYVKQHTNELQDIQIAIDNMPQYSRKTSLEFCGILKEVDMSMDQVVCKIAEVISVQIQDDAIYVSHRIKRKQGERPILAKFESPG